MKKNISIYLILICLISCSDLTLSENSIQLSPSSNAIWLDSQYRRVTDDDIIAFLNDELNELESVGNIEQDSNIFTSLNSRSEHIHRWVNSGQYYYLDKQPYIFIYEIVYCSVPGCTDAYLRYMGRIIK